MERLRELLEALEIDRRRFVLMLAVSALGTTALIAVVNMAMRSPERSSFLLACYFVAAIVIYAWAQRQVLLAAAEGAERLIARLRREIMASTRAADYALMQLIGRAPIHAAVAQEAQTISNTLPVIVVGVQQSVLLVFVSLYLAWLSPPAFLVVGLFGIFAVWFHVTRLRRLQAETDRLARAQGTMFDEFRGMLAGAREIAFNEARGDDVVRELGTLSGDRRALGERIKAHWAREYTFTQTLFYVLLGLMVFVVPMLSEGYHEVVIPATMGALFMIGPLSSLAQGIPAVNDTLRSLGNIRALKARLEAAVRTGVDEDAEALPEGPRRTLTLDGVGYTFVNGEGKPAFVLEPVEAEFRAGEIAFVTGGNGSGKSTLFRLMTGLVRPATGRLLLDGAPVAPGQAGAYRDGVGVVYADFHLFRELHGLEHADPERVAALLERFGIADKTRLEDGAFTTADLSAGQRKRLALVVALLQEAPVLMLDEWAADQDPQFRRRFYREILPGLAAEGRIVVCITHDEGYFDVADALYAMADGRMSRVR